MPFEDVLVVIDGSGESVACLERGVALGRPVGGTVHLLVVPPPGVDRREGTTHVAASQVIGDALETVDPEGVDLRSLVLTRGPVEPALRNYVREHEVDVVVVTGGSDRDRTVRTVQGDDDLPVMAV